jgi:sugar-specific transcriptional regulator TrmB
MVMAEINEILEDLGLSRKEVEVYLALLGLGEDTASRVSEIANLNRVTTYTILKSLQEKGFCSIYEKNRVQYFKPIKPEQILGLLEEKKTKIKSILPSLKDRIRKIEEKPEISLYEGKKGLTTLLDIILKDAEKKKEILAYGNFTIGEKIIEYPSLYFRKTRLSKKIKIKAVVDRVNKEFVKEEKWKTLSEVKIYKDLEKLDSYVFITENKVAYLIFKGQIIGVLINNKQIAEKEKFNFEQLWRKSEK